MGNDPRIRWYKTPIDRQRLRELTSQSDARALIHLSLHLMFCVGTGLLTYLSFRHMPWFITIAALFIHGTFYNFLGMFTGIHELAHKTSFKSRRLNEFFYHLLGILTWNNVYKFRASHQAHHQVTVYRNLDREVVLPERFRRIDWFFMFTVNPFSGAGGVPGIVSMVAETTRYAFGIFNGEWENALFPQSAQQGRRKIFRFARITLAFHLLSAAWFIYSGNWILILVVNLGCFIAPWLATLCALPQHIGLSGDVPDWRLNSRTMILNPFIRFFYWNMNYHVEHHMYAGVPFYKLPALHREICHDCPEPSRGLLRTWKTILPVIRKQRDDPGFFAVPELPESG